MDLDEIPSKTRQVIFHHQHWPLYHDKAIDFHVRPLFSFDIYTVCFRKLAKFYVELWKYPENSFALRFRGISKEKAPL